MEKIFTCRMGLLLSLVFLLLLQPATAQKKKKLDGLKDKVGKEALKKGLNKGKEILNNQQSGQTQTTQDKTAKTETASKSTGSANAEVDNQIVGKMVQFNHPELVDFDVATFRAALVDYYNSRAGYVPPGHDKNRKKLNALNELVRYDWGVEVSDPSLIENKPSFDIEKSGFGTRLKPFLTKEAYIKYFCNPETGGSCTSNFGGAGTNEFQVRRAFDAFRKSGIYEAMVKAPQNIPSEEIIITLTKIPEYDFDMKGYKFEIRKENKTYYYWLRMSATEAEQLLTSQKNGVLYLNLVEQNENAEWSLYRDPFLENKLVSFKLTDLYEKVWAVNVSSGRNEQIELPYILPAMDEAYFNQFYAGLEDYMTDPKNKVIYDFDCIKPKYLAYLKAQVPSANELYGKHQKMLIDACSAGKKMFIDSKAGYIRIAENDKEIQVTANSLSMSACEFEKELKAGRKTEYTIGQMQSNPANFIKQLNQSERLCRDRDLIYQQGKIYGEQYINGNSVPDPKAFCDCYANAYADYLVATNGKYVSKIIQDARTRSLIKCQDYR